jgi:hypothetical protein
MIRKNTTQQQEDHDVLVRIDQKVSDLQTAVKKIEDGSASKISALERDKADRKIVEELQHKVNNDVENRIRNLENDGLSEKGEHKGAWLLYSILGGIITLIATILTALGALGFIKL